MPKPKDFTPAMEREREKLAKKLKGKVKSPWGLATWIVRRNRKRRKRK